MDMTLYALVMSKFNEQTQCETWNGFRIEIVDELPSFQAPNVIYFVKTSFTPSIVELLSSDESESE